MKRTDPTGPPAAGPTLGSARRKPEVDRDPQPLQTAGWDAHLRLRYAIDPHAAHERTTVVKREHDGPLTVQKPLYPEGDRVCHQLLLHTSGGLAGGDRLAIDVELASRAHVLVTTPAATRWYRSLGQPASQTTLLRVGSKAALEWLPMESIVFNGAIARIDTRLELDRAAALLLWDIQCLGRIASGERFDAGAVSITSRLRIDGRLVWSERGRLAGGDPIIAASAGWGGHPVCATLIAAGPALDRDLVQAVRALDPPVGETGATMVDDVLIVRYLGGSIAAARDHLQATWRVLRPVLVGMAPNLPRIWST